MSRSVADIKAALFDVIDTADEATLDTLKQELVEAKAAELRAEAEAKIAAAVQAIIDAPTPLAAANTIPPTDDEIALFDDEARIDAEYHVRSLPGITEFWQSGGWLWLKGHTYAIKDQLMAAGFGWHTGKTKAINPTMDKQGLAVWYWMPPSARGKKRRHSNTDENEIVRKYGKQVIR